MIIFNIHAYLHGHIPVSIYTHTHAYIHSCILTYVHTCAYAHSFTLWIAWYVSVNTEAEYEKNL